MDSKEYRKCSRDIIDYVANYLENIEARPVLPKVKPGYLKSLIPENAPEEPEKWNDLMTDIDRVIMPGIAHWHSPNFHAYYELSHSYPSLCADILTDGIGCLGFSWVIEEKKKKNILPVLKSIILI
jgi:aromatic-L-amino-acid decarboxylase